jgi:brefeldin A-inhibited guanine nucleotide-exchange protein
MKNCFFFSSHLLDITSDKQREFLFDMQMKDVESIARELMSNAGTIREEFTTAKHLEHVRPMFQVKKFN